MRPARGVKHGDVKMPDATEVVIVTESDHYPGDDDGVLEPSDSLLSDRLTSDVLDAGIDAGSRYVEVTSFGMTPAEERRGETLDQLLAEEEPDLTVDSAALGDWVDDDGSNGGVGELLRPDQGDGRDDESEEIATDVGRVQFDVVSPEDD